MLSREIVKVVERKSRNTQLEEMTKTGADRRRGILPEKTMKTKEDKRGRIVKKW